MHDHRIPLAFSAFCLILGIGTLSYYHWVTLPTAEQHCRDHGWNEVVSFHGEYWCGIKAAPSGYLIAPISPPTTSFDVQVDVSKLTIP